MEENLDAPDLDDNLPLVSSSAVKEPISLIDECLELISVCVPSTKQDDKNNTLFRIVATLSLGAARIKTSDRWVRFSAAFDFDYQSRGAIAEKSAHLLENLPQFPQKYSRFFVDHTEPAFIERRRKQLEKYLILMCNLPRTCNYWCLLDFLGLGN